MPSVACQRHPNQDVKLHVSGGPAGEGSGVCFQCYVLRTETHEAAISEPTCAAYQVLDVLPPQSTAAVWIEMPPPDVVPVPEAGEQY